MIIFTARLKNLFIFLFKIISLSLNIVQRGKCSFYASFIPYLIKALKAPNIELGNRETLILQMNLEITSLFQSVETSAKQLLIASQARDFTTY